MKVNEVINLGHLVVGKDQEQDLKEGLKVGGGHLGGTGVDLMIEDILVHPREDEADHVIELLAGHVADHEEDIRVGHVTEVELEVVEELLGDHILVDEVGNLADRVIDQDPMVVEETEVEHHIPIDHVVGPEVEVEVELPSGIVTNVQGGVEAGHRKDREGEGDLDADPCLNLQGVEDHASGHRAGRRRREMNRRIERSGKRGTLGKKTITIRNRGRREMRRRRKECRLNLNQTRRTT